MVGSGFGDNVIVGKHKGSLGKKEFEAFFRLLYVELCNFTFGYTQNYNAAEDIVQSAFVTLWEQKERWGEEDNIKSYLYRSVRNAALNYLRHQKVRCDTEIEMRRYIKEWKGDSHGQNNVKEYREIIHRGIKRLPARCREIYLLSRESGLTYREIANLLEISEKTVETQMGRALKSLRMFISRHLSLPISVGLLFLMFFP